MPELYLIAINLTRRCNLACSHCYMDAEMREQGGDGELSSAEVKDLLDQIAGRSDETMVVLTGGEPLLRKDLESLVAHGSGLGLTIVVGTNGVLLDEQRVIALKKAGAMGLGISLDSLDPTHHDDFRGCHGSWEKTLAGMDACRQHGLPFQVHFSVTEKNAHEVDAMIDFAKAVGAHVLNIFFLVCTGRGETMSDISPAHYEQVLSQLVRAQEQTRDLIIRARCAPHFKRVAYQHNPESPQTRAQGYEGGGCLAGSHYCRITPEGAVTACPYIPDAEDNIRQTPFWDIWDNSPTFQLLREPKLDGKCGQCEFRELCIGCRARPLAMGKSLMAEDPWCDYQPKGDAIIQPLMSEANDDIHWTPEAEQRISRVPGFLRKMVRKRTEEHAREQGEHEVTTEHLAALASRRFGEQPRGQGTEDRGQGKPTDEQNLHPDNCTLTTLHNSHPGQGESARPAWDADALTRLEFAPDFIRSGIKKAAEQNARREGKEHISSEDLTRYRNRAMQLAVRRLKGFGVEELSFDAYATAKERVPRLMDNDAADKRFTAIREHVESKLSSDGEGLGVLDQELLDKMKAELKK